MNDRNGRQAADIDGIEAMAASAVVDIRESKRAPADVVALAQQHDQKFRLLVESVSDYGIFMLDTRGCITSWNVGAERMKGYRADEIIGRHFSRFYPPEDKLANKPEWELKIAAETGRYEEEGWRVRKDDSRFWASIVISAIRDSTGTLVGYAKVSRDLTERRQAERRLAEAHRLQAVIIESAPYAIIATDEAGLIKSVNPAAERMLGYTAEELCGREATGQIHDPNEIAAHAIELSAELSRIIEPGFEVLACKSRLDIETDREWTYVRKDGFQLPVNLAVTALCDGDGHINGFLTIASDITERKRRDEYIRHIAHHDTLTGLPNRVLLQDRLAVAVAHARRRQRKLAVLMLDLDHFKRVNDSLGHQVGDELLAQVATRIVGCVRACDTVARMGGDEFVIILDDIDGDPARAGIERVAADLVERVSAPIQVGGHELTVTPSIGISRFPADADDGGQLLKHADTAMYLAKAAGRRGYRVFDPGMAKAAGERLSLENDLRRGLNNKELELHYQPQICLITGAVVGMEALLRWTHPVRGAVSPADFIPVAEESGLILSIGEWVLTRACRDAKLIQMRVGQPLRLAVNISARQFRQADLSAAISDALRDSGLAACDLELEITEGVIMAQTDDAIERLQRIRDLGVTIAIDDFGVGFSSLSYVARFPIDALKIDRSFVNKLLLSAGDRAVAEAIIALAQSLGIRVVAEGVETVSQLQYLRSRHCDVAQGFYFGHAVPPHSFSADAFLLGDQERVEDAREMPISARRAAGMRQ